MADHDHGATGVSYAVLADRAEEDADHGPVPPAPNDQKVGANRGRHECLPGAPLDEGARYLDTWELAHDSLDDLTQLLL
jgi:hypothetical protein